MKRPVIGSAYRPTSFETRDRNGKYEALNRGFSNDALELQRSYLDEEYPPERSNYYLELSFIYAIGIVAIILAVVYGI